MNELKIHDIQVGKKESFSMYINEDMMSSFLSTTGDTSPIHVHESYAKDLGFESKVVYGMLTASFYSTLVGVYLPGKYAVLHNIDISFNRPVYVGNRLDVTGEVISKNETFGQIEIRAIIKNDLDQTISKAKIKVGIRER
ncbi:MAG: dehydratase [Oligoflexia bacterium]|nr:dehydratase [Oligoflexia bacterium]